MENESDGDKNRRRQKVNGNAPISREAEGSLDGVVRMLSSTSYVLPGGFGTKDTVQKGY